MKTKRNGLIAIMFICSISLFAQRKTETFTVNGNCEMCKTRIENAAKSVKGVKKAKWAKETKMVEVSYDSTKTDVQKVHMAIAKVGHDTQVQKASDDVYSALPGCCKYDRVVATKNE